MLESTQTQGSLWDALHRARGALEAVRGDADAHGVAGALMEEIDRVLTALDPTVPRSAPTPIRGVQVQAPRIAVGGWFSAVLASLRDGVVLVDDAGLVVAFNPAAERICECSREAALGRSLSEVVAASALRAACALELARRRTAAAGDGDNSAIECVARLADGTELRVELVVTRTPGPGPGLYTVQMRDVTERVQAVRAREDILAVVSHDLKTPLTSVQMNADLLLRFLPHDGSVPARQLASAIRRTTERMARLVRDLLDFASLQAGHVALEPSVCDPRTLVDEAVTMLSVVAAERGIRLERDGDRTAGVQVLCDRERILQVLTNLLGNAMKFSPSNRAVTVRCDPTPDGNAVRIRVTDHGPGIPAEQVPRVFERYWSSARNDSRGTGLGLFIVRGLVEAHGGEVGVESAVGKGSTFWFTLPVSRPAVKLFT